MTSLADKVARVKEMDAKRTQGEWQSSGCYVSGESFDIYDEGGHTEDDAQFIAHAPQMAALITQLWDENQKLEAEFQAKDRAFMIASDQAIANGCAYQNQREVLGMARDILLGILPQGGMHYGHVREGITAIDNVMKGA